MSPPFHSKQKLNNKNTDSGSKNVVNSGDNPGAKQFHHIGEKLRHLTNTLLRILKRSKQDVNNNNSSDNVVQGGDNSSVSMPRGPFGPGATFTGPSAALPKNGYASIHEDVCNLVTPFYESNYDAPINNKTSYYIPHSSNYGAPIDTFKTKGINLFSDTSAFDNLGGEWGPRNDLENSQ